MESPTLEMCRMQPPAIRSDIVRQGARVQHAVDPARDSRDEYSIVEKHLDLARPDRTRGKGSRARPRVLFHRRIARTTEEGEITCNPLKSMKITVDRGGSPQVEIDSPVSIAMESEGKDYFSYTPAPQAISRRGRRFSFREGDKEVLALSPTISLFHQATPDQGPPNAMQSPDTSSGGREPRWCSTRAPRS